MEEHMEHEHDYEREHTHGDEHTHEHLDDKEKLVRLLGYLKDHNEHHAHEILHLAEDASDLGNGEVAALLEEASKILDKSNALLSEALRKL